MPTIGDARQALDTARDNLRRGDARAAGNRAYYAIFYATGALLTARTDIPATSIKTHDGMRRMFDLNFVKTGLFPKAISGFFTDVQQTRWAADYTDDIPEPIDIVEAIEEAAAFVAACETLLEAGEP